MEATHRLGRYILLKRLASGGMAEIFLAKLVGEAGFEKQIVIKKILPQWASDRDFVSMLVDEAKIAVQLNHPNIVAVHELAREDDDYYIAMEFVNGVDLRRLMQKAHAMKSKVPIEIVLSIAVGVLEGLAYAHAKRDAQGIPLEIIHRDISPQNILVSFDGTVKITDFGIAKATSRSQETATGVLKGKFAYMSPEQANQEALDSRSDLFSLGIVLYELVTGERLFHRGSDLETLERVRRAEPEISPEALKRIPQRLREVLFRSLKKSRVERFQEAASFRDALLAFARRSKKGLHRERVAEFMESLFVPDQKTEDPQVPPTLEPTKTVHPVVLAQADESTQSEWVSPDERESPPRRVYPSMRGTLLVAISTLAVFAFGVHEFHNVIGFVAEMDNGNTPPIKVSHEVRRRVVQPPPTPPEIPPPVRADQAIAMTPETTAAVEPPPPESMPAILSGAVREEKGFLSVQAIPWGTVTVDGGKGRETPLRRMSLKAGAHTVRVTYPPGSLTASTQVEIRPGREIVCIATFRGGKKIRCEK